MKILEGCVRHASMVLLLASCAVGPSYDKPRVEMAAAYKEAGDWVVANPRDAAPKGKWWEVFDDPVLNGLMEQVSVSNQTLAAGWQQLSSGAGL